MECNIRKYKTITIVTIKYRHPFAKYILIYYVYITIKYTFKYKLLK